nr:MAG TPA: hypothetical protein [Caudoviricetes sp.]
MLVTYLLDKVVKITFILRCCYFPQQNFTQIKKTTIK